MSETKKRKRTDEVEEQEEDLGESPMKKRKIDQTNPLDFSSPKKPKKEKTKKKKVNGREVKNIRILYYPNNTIYTPSIRDESGAQIQTRDDFENSTIITFSNGTAADGESEVIFNDELPCQLNITGNHRPSLNLQYFPSRTRTSINEGLWEFRSNYSFHNWGNRDYAIEYAVIFV